MEGVVVDTGLCRLEGLLAAEVVLGDVDVALDRRHRDQGQQHDQRGAEDRRDHREAALRCESPH